MDKCIGKTHPKKSVNSWGSFMDCVTFHLLTMLMNDAAEAQCFYINNLLKKPTRVLNRQFIQELKQLNTIFIYCPECTTASEL